MSIASEFREFAVKGNVVDMAVGVVVGGAFGKITTSLVNDIIMPPIGVLLGSRPFNNLSFTIQQAAADKPAVTINYGAFLQTLVDFLIIAWAIFMVVKAINRLRTIGHKPEPKA